jgi:S23 ribosomal protein.
MQSSAMADFKKLHVWRKAHALTLSIHRVSATIRGSPYASLRSQLVRAAMSIPANIVEGRGQKSEREFARFLRIALNAASESEYHLITCRDMGVISQGDFRSSLTQVVEVRRMLHGLLNRLERGVQQRQTDKGKFSADRRKP